MRRIIAAILAMVVANAVSADPVCTFCSLTSNTSEDIGSQLRMTVGDAGSGGVTRAAFTSENWVGIPSSITEIFFDGGTLLGIWAVSGSGAGVAFSDPGDNDSLPGGSTAVPPFVRTDHFPAGADPPHSSNGVNALGEWVTITFNLLAGATCTPGGSQPWGMAACASLGMFSRSTRSPAVTRTSTTPSLSRSRSRARPCGARSAWPSPAGRGGGCEDGLRSRRGR